LASQTPKRCGADTPVRRRYCPNFVFLGFGFLGALGGCSLRFLRLEGFDFSMVRKKILTAKVAENTAKDAKQAT
jgi:hypothetical protein